MIVVDRIENKRAVLDVDGETVEISVTALPEGAQEGTILTLALCDEQGAELQRDNEERLERLRARDPGDMEIDI